MKATNVLPSQKTLIIEDLLLSLLLSFENLKDPPPLGSKIIGFH